MLIKASLFSSTYFASPLAAFYYDTALLVSLKTKRPSIGLIPQALSFQAT
jgi:hypothetical protein